jgi:tetratricopeptide (TPR) repeat protein
MRLPRFPRIALLALVALSPRLAPADDVTLLPGAAFKVSGGKLSGTITAETPTTLTIQTGGGAAQNVPVEAIASVTYAGQPGLLTLADSRVAAGNLAEALDQYARAATEAAGRPLIAQAAQFARAKALAELARSDPKRQNEAIAALDAFLKANPRSRHVGPALEGLARLSLARKDAAKAGPAAAQLAAIPWAADRAAVLQARVQSLQGQPDAAGQTLDALIARLPAESPARSEARLVRAEVLAAGGKTSEAEAAVREVIAESSPEAVEIQAAAQNTLGDCLRAAGKPKEALFAYLHTDILHDADRDQHARALAAIAALWRELKQPERADEALRRLKSLYPQSPYTAAATAPPAM